MKKRINNTGENKELLSQIIAAPKALYYSETEALVNSDSWLRSILEPDKKRVLHQYRALYSELFLKRVLYPLAEQRVDLNERMVADLLVNYKMSITVPGGDFEISNVIGSLLSRFQCYSGEDANIPAERATFMDKDHYLFTALSELDLQSIDQMVDLCMNINPTYSNENVE
jgi:hypothetical protein